MEIMYKVGEVAVAVVTGLIVMLNAIAPLTKSDWDNKALEALRWVEDKVFKLLFPMYFRK